MKKNDAWSIYWETGNQESCITNSSTQDQLFLTNIWHNFAISMNNKSTVLDLATGNGSVPSCLLKHNGTLDITGVDYANINPQKLAQNNPLLKQVKFIPNTNIESLPFNDNSFEYVTSQFGIEYSSIERTAAEFARILKPNGKFLFLMHHEQSEVVKPARIKLKEFGYIFDSGLLESLSLYINGKVNLEEINTLGAKIISDNSFSKSKAITGQIFTAINKLIELKVTQKHSSEVMDIFEGVKLRVFAEHQRLEQLVVASLSEKKLKVFCENLNKLDIYVDYNVISLGDNNEVLGWQVMGHKV